MCGKDAVLKHTDMPAVGSPPHVRERRLHLLGTTAGKGITPACAGKTNGQSPTACVYEDHPRMCGKDHCIVGFVNPIAGSPPHVRERPTKLDEMRGWMRITPACAGKTISPCHTRTTL